MMETKPTTESNVIPFKRRLGFRHRVKRRIIDGELAEALPSQMVVSDGNGGFVKYEFDDEQAELDFINGVYPTKYRVPAPDEDISKLEKWQIRWREVSEEDHLVLRHPSQSNYKVKRARGETPESRELLEVVKEVPCEWIGLQAGDVIAMCLGGSGDYFAFRASKRLHTMGGEVYRIPPFLLQEHRGTGAKEDDATLLAQLLDSHFGLFYPTLVRDRRIILVRETFKVRIDAMKDRMACTQRLRQRLIGKIFCSEEGGFPEGDIEKRFDELKANDQIYQAIEKMENQALKEMTAAVEATEVWNKLFEPVEGVGPGIAARIMSVVIDIRRFETSAKLRKYLGVHVLPDGTFPRRRNGVIANWSPDGRQGLYILGDQFIKKKDSTWGQVLVKYKRIFRERHPEVCIAVKNSVLGIHDLIGKGVTLIPIGPEGTKKPKSGKYEVKHPVTGEMVTVSGPQRYGKGHIHKMAFWRTLSLFVRWLHQEWWKLEKAAKITPMETSDSSEAQAPKETEGEEPKAQAA